MKTPQKSISRRVVRYYWNCVTKYPLYLGGLFVAIPFTILVSQSLPPLILARVLRRLSIGAYTAGHPWQSFSHDIILYAVLSFGASLVMWRVMDYLVWNLEGKVQRDIARHVFNHLTSESADFHANHFSGSLVSQTNKIVGSYVRMGDTTFFSTLPLISSLTFTVIILLPRAPIFVIALVFFAIFYVVTSTIVSKHVRKFSSEHATADSKQTGYIADVIGNVMAVKGFAGEAFENDTFYHTTEHTHHRLLRLMRAHQRQMAYFGSVSRVISVTAFVLAIVSVVSFHADIATMFLILNFTSSIVDQLFNFSNSSLRNYNRAVGDASDMVEILERVPEIQDPLNPKLVNMNRGAIRFKNVVFTHKGANKPIFNGLDLRIKTGEKVGLVGQSGSGKTSLTRILLRFSDIDSGLIEIDGQNITDVIQADLRRAISYVPQEPILFHRTIAENIAYGRHEATHQEIEAIARKANADEFIQSLPDKYKTVVGERGVKLSGGQRQRIAIARAMLKNAPILVLDEATSALDSESEALIQDALWKLMEGRTAIVIAHRLSTIQKMDRIIVLSNGKIVEEGNHAYLLRMGGVYAKLWNRQSGGFIEE
jgi:ATP-binding cassette subfamily B protein